MSADSGAIIRPRYGQESLADVMPSVLAALGVPGATDHLGLASGPLSGVRVVTVILLDGLGYELLPLAAPYAPTLTALDRVGGRAITAGFPSTTPTSLASLGTGAAPGAHGLVGFLLNIPGTDLVLNHIRWRDEPDPLRWQPLPTQFDRARAAGVAAHIVSRPEYAGSGLTVAVFRGGTYVGVGKDMLAARIGSLLRKARGKAVIYGYDPDVDAAGHVYGVDSPQWRVAVAEADWLVTTVLDALPRDGALVVVADHGQLNVPAEHRFDLDLDLRLRTGVRVVAGEARVRYLHTVPGAAADVLDTWRGVLGDAAWVSTRDEAIAEGWFGPVAEDHLQRIGDVVAACTGDHVVLATKTDPPTVEKLLGFHGSATPAEMLIPLIVARR